MLLQNEISWRKNIHITEKTGFTDSKNTDFMHIAYLLWLIDMVLASVLPVCLCKVLKDACNYVCLARNLNIFIWCYLLVNWYLRKILILRTIISASESYWVLFVKRVGGAALYNNNGVWIVKRNLAEFCQHTHQCGSGLKEKLLPPPATEMAFLVRCYANCLQPWASKVSNYYFFFVGIV